MVVLCCVLLGAGAGTGVCITVAYWVLWALLAET